MSAAIGASAHAISVGANCWMRASTPGFAAPARMLTHTPSGSMRAVPTLASMTRRGGVGTMSG